jgi:hypothetical protein
MAMQQIDHTVFISPATARTEPPEIVIEALVEHLQGDREISAIFRLGCHAWRDAHDRILSVLKPNGAPPDSHLWRKFGGVKTLYFNTILGRDDYALRDLALAPLRSLSGLVLGSSFGIWGVRDGTTNVTDKGMRALSSL